MAFYWQHHLFIDLVLAVIVSVCIWLAPNMGVEPLLFADPVVLPEILSRWLAGCLTLIGLIIATTGFLTSLMQSEEFAPLAKSASAAQLWEILRQNLGWLFIACIYSSIGTFLVLKGDEFKAFACIGTIVLTATIISLGKLVWVMRSVLFVKKSNALKSRFKSN